MSCTALVTLRVLSVHRFKANRRVKTSWLFFKLSTTMELLSPFWPIMVNSMCNTLFDLSLVHNIMLEPWVSQESWASWESIFSSQILFLMSNFSTIWLVGRRLTLATQCWKRNRVYFCITPMLAMLHWWQRHYCEPGFREKALIVEKHVLRNYQNRTTKFFLLTAFYKTSKQYWL